MTKPHLGGAYDKDGDGNTIMEDVWGYLLVKYDIKSMLDIGSGYGHALLWPSKFLVAGTAIEGDDDAVARNVWKGPIVHHDFTTGPAPLGDGRWDLAWSAEFLEHVDEQYMGNYMAAFQRCKIAVVTHGEPGQEGHHHVTLRDDAWWVNAFWKYGLRFDGDETGILRRTDRWKAPWGRRTLMFFHNEKWR